MIQHHSRSLLKHHAGRAALAVLLAGTVLTAHAEIPATVEQTAQAAPADSASTASPHISFVLPLDQNAAAQSRTTRPASVIPASQRQHPPDYPRAAVKKHQEGTVPLLVLVGADGEPRQIWTVATDAPPDLVAATKKAAWQWRYHPARRNGKAVKAWVRVPVIFRLRASQQAPVPTVNASAGLSIDGRHPPIYPEVAKKHHKQGTVVLLVLVDKYGRTVTVKMVQGIPDAPLLNQAALKAAWRWRYNRKKRDGKPYEAWIKVPVTFKLSERY